MPERKFGRIPSSFDSRDWQLGSFIPSDATFGTGEEKMWDFPAQKLDQENSSHCVGFSMANFGINLPTFTLYTNDDGHCFYYKCKEKDGNPHSEEGATVRTAAKVLQDEGVVDNYAFASNVAQIKWWLLNKGPLIVGTVWTEKMMNPDGEGMLDITGFIVGGHAYLLNGIRKDDCFRVLNSWGSEWGKNGEAYISYKDFEALLSEGGEVLAAVELEDYMIKKENWIVKLMRFIHNLIRFLKW
jgi:hypothetical protein